MTGPHHRIGAALVSAVLGTALLTAPTAAGVTPITFSLNLFDTCQYGIGPASSNLTIRLFDSNGDLLERMSTTSDAGGNWQVCLSVPSSPGFKLRANGGGADRTIVLPDLTMNGNRVSDVVSGHWVPSTALQVCVNHYLTLNTFSYFCRGGSSSATGAYSIDFTPDVNARGGDQASATYVSGSDQFMVRTTLPYMLVRRASPAVSGSLNRGKAATITVKTGSGTLRGSVSVQATWQTSFFGSFATSSGAVVMPRAGNKVVGSFAGDATITVPDIATDGVASTDVVTGTCMPNRPYELHAYRANFSDSVYRNGTTNGSGQLSLDLTADIDLHQWDIVELTCLYASGDQIYAKGYVTAP